ncbi:CDP-glucose 4,6-dehydratase [Novispirillum sp. DQ9]|uniref:CDP-glucose 4,6-dehydratase n=1 Tax=Novispirillum sp. DQ9 TaxID=3398612 RepID=UPI003C7A28DE
MSAFWSDRRVLLTGHTGFKGGWLSLWLHRLGAKVTGLALDPTSEPSLWRMVEGEGAVASRIGDIRDADVVRAAVAEARPQIVLHMAAQALVRPSYADPVGTFATNIMGTAHVLDALRGAPGLECVVVVTSDKVYENDGAGRPFAEDDRLGGHDPYSNSKACTELVTQSFRDSFFGALPVVTARAGNVIGGGDWSVDRLIPDAVRALAAGTPVRLRNPGATRPWQHVLEPLGGYLALARAHVEKRPGAPLAANFGPDPASFRTVAEVLDAFSARFAGRPGWEQDPGDHPKEAAALTLTSGLAERTLSWTPRLDFAATMAWTADWYAAHRSGADMVALCRTQIDDYMALGPDLWS